MPRMHLVPEIDHRSAVAREPLDRAVNRVAGLIDDLGHSLINVSTDPLNFRERARRSKELQLHYRDLVTAFDKLRTEFGIEPRRWASLPHDVTDAVDTLMNRIASVPRRHARRQAKAGMGGKSAT